MKLASGDANYRVIRACRKRFLHYYWHVLDPVMGPMSIRVASYFPFNVTCYLNGHSFVAQELRRDGVCFRQADNAFLVVADVAALQAAADRVSAALLQQRCNYWVRRSQLRYDLSKLRAKGLVERIGASRRYRLTPLGLKLGVLLVKLRMRLLGPLTTLVTTGPARRQPSSANSVDNALREVDIALDHLTAAFGLKQVA